MKTKLKNFSNFFAALTMIILLVIGCKKDGTDVVEVVPDEPKPTASFDYKLSTANQWQEYQFTNTSTEYKSFLWQFGDGTTSTEASPKHKYAEEGNYMISLTTRNNQGYTAKKEILLKVFDPTIDYTKYGENYMATIGGTYTVNVEAGAGADSNEGSKKLVDQNITTKFLQAGFDGTQRCTFELKTPAVVGAYTLTSGNDAAGRDPKQWFLQGSNDGIQFETLHTVSECPWANENSGASRRQTKLFHIKNQTAYKFYRLHIKQIRSGTVFQLSEWTINKKQP